MNSAPDVSRGSAAKPVRLVAGPNAQGERLDRFLAGATDLSRRRSRALIAEGRVCLNRQVVRVQSRALTIGDVIDVMLPESEQLAPPALPFSPPSILFQDRWLLIADKPFGVLSQSAENSPADDVPFDARVLMDLAYREGRRPHLRMLHRLDRQTSGAVLFSRNPQAQAPLARSWSKNEVRRSYLAVVNGHPDFEEREIEAAIGRDRSHSWRFRVSPGGKAARTLIRVMNRLPNGDSVLRCRLETGRTHQVRVHLAHIGHPVLGDRLYGSGVQRAAPRLLLHAHTLVLPHPGSGQQLEIEAPLPGDFTDFVEEATR